MLIIFFCKKKKGGEGVKGLWIYHAVQISLDLLSYKIQTNQKCGSHFVFRIYYLCYSHMESLGYEIFGSKIVISHIDS